MTAPTVVPIRGASGIPTRMRDLADEIEKSGDLGIHVTVVCGTDVYFWGPACDQRVVEGAVFDLTFALHKLMGLPVKRTLEAEGE